MLKINKIILKETINLRTQKQEENRKEKMRITRQTKNSSNQIVTDNTNRNKFRLEKVKPMLIRKIQLEVVLTEVINNLMDKTTIEKIIKTKKE